LYLTTIFSSTLTCYLTYLFHHYQYLKNQCSLEVVDYEMLKTNELAFADIEESSSTRMSDETVFQDYLQLLRQHITFEEDLDILRGNMWLAFYYRSQERYSEAEVLYVSILERQRSIFGMDHIELWTTKYQLGELYFMMEEWNLAQEYLQTVYDFISTHCGPKHFLTIHSLFRLTQMIEKQTIESKSIVDHTSKIKEQYCQCFLSAMEVYGRFHLLTKSIFEEGKDYLQDLQAAREL
jgi:tetratricopeptide (TPR) repeat protein